MDKIEEKVIELVSLCLVAEKEQVTRKSDLFADLNADKLALAELYVKIEEEFKLKITPGTWERVKTIDDIVKLIEEYSDELL